MIHPFCMTTKATNNEDYAKIIKKRMNIYLVLMSLGLLTLALLYFSKYVLGITIDGHFEGFYSGLAAGLIGAGFLLFVKNKRLLSNEIALKEARIRNTDERIQEIGSIAMRLSTIILLVSSYVICLVGGLIFPEHIPVLTKVLLIQVGIFLVTFFVSFRIYDKRM